MVAGQRAVGTSSPHVRAKRHRRRKEILHAALRAFREEGYHATTLEDIVGRLGIRKAALYYYFPDKEALLYECHRESLAEIDRIVADARKLRTAPERLRHVIREHVRVMIETLEGSPLAFEVSALAPDHQAEVIAARDAYERFMRRVIDKGIREGAFRRVDSKIAVFAILGAINWIARWYRPGGAFHASDLGEQYSVHLVGGLTCR